MKIDVDEKKLREYLSNCRELNCFCSQNGWIDNDTLTYEIQRREDDSVRVAVNFTEVIMEGSGCIADRIDRFGMLELFLSPTGEVEHARVL